MKIESNGLGSLNNDRAQAENKFVQRERLNDSTPRQWRCESLATLLKGERRKPNDLVRIQVGLLKLFVYEKFNLLAL